MTLGNTTVPSHLTVSAGNSITVPDGVTIKSQGGDVTFQALEEVDLAWYWGISAFKLKQADVAIDVGDATIQGRNVTLTTSASTTKTVEVSDSMTYDTRAVVLGDVNGDGCQDLVQGNYDGPLLLYLNNGTADPFSDVQPATIADSMNVSSLALGDVNGDGRLDLVAGIDTSDAGDSPTQLWINTGVGNPLSGSALSFGPLGDNAQAVALADLNKDG